MWLQNFDFEIEYKPGYVNYLADMLSREQAFPFLGMFLVGYLGSGPSKRPKTPKEIEEMNSKLYFKKWEKVVVDHLTPEERQKILAAIDRKVENAQFNSTLISQIQQSPMNIKILERWEKNAFLGMRNGNYQLSKLCEVWLYVEKPNGK